MAGRGTELLAEKKSYWAMAARECDSCRSTPALLFCRTHSAFLCGPCDAGVHAVTAVSSSPHERVWMCEVCEQAPAAFTCKADAATLCAPCDADVHSANPLARRHDRAHVVPFFHSPANTTANPNPNTAIDFLLKRTDDFYEEKEMEGPEMKMKVDLHDHHDQYLFSAVDPYLDLEYGSSVENTRFHHHADSVVPAVQNISVPPPPPAHDHHVHFFGGGYDLDFMNSNQTCSYAPSLGHSVSSEVGVVPEESTATDMTSNSYDQYGLTVNQTAVATVATGTDREARVMRYREKKKNRKFEKTVRYASRKAYAETRPRVKGRFVKRTELDCEGDADAAVVDSIYASSATAVAALMVDAGYGVVPSF